VDRGEHPHEAHCLKLDCSKAKGELRWVPQWNLEQAVDKVMEWVQAYRKGRDIRKVCRKQIEEYEMMVGSA
jgi:CDP-glucose 4,6-dehydratase